MTDSSKPPATPFVPVSQEDITAFAGTLLQWGATLPPKELALVQVLVERAQGLIPDDVKQHQLRVAFAAAMQSVYLSCARVWHDDPAAWTRVDPIWYKAGPTVDGEEIHVTVRIAAQKAASTPPAVASSSSSSTPVLPPAPTSSSLPTSKLPPAAPPPTPSPATPTQAASGPAGTTPQTKGKE